MASTYSNLLRLELIATGEQSSTWGQTTNTTLGTLLEAAIAGNASKALADADYTLTTVNGASDEARYQGISFTGALTATRTITVPTLTKHYQFHNGTNQSLVIKTAAGASITLPTLHVCRAYCDGAGVYFSTLPVLPYTGAPASLSLPALTVTGASTFGTVASGSTPITVGSSTSAFSVDVKGRAADNIGIIRFLNSAGSSELVRLQAGSGVTPFALYTNNATATVFTTDLTGNMVLAHGATIASGLTVSAGGIGVTTGNVALSAGDLFIYRSGAPTQGVVYLGNSSARYLHCDGANYHMPNGDLYVSGQRVWTAGIFNPAAYAPLSGATFTGTLRSSAQILANGTANVCSGVWDTVQGVAAGIMLGAGNGLYFANLDGNGNYAGSWRGYFNGSGDFTAAGNVYAFSDARLKCDFRALDDAAQIVDGLAAAVRRYRWIGRDDEQVGVIAQDVLPVLPEAIGTTDDGTLTVADRPMVAALLVAMSQLQARVARLEAAHGG